MLVVDWYTKKIVGHTLDLRSKSSHWLSALNQAACQRCPDGTKAKGVKLMLDNGCQLTSVAFMRAASLMGDRADLYKQEHSQGERPISKGCLEH